MSAKRNDNLEKADAELVVELGRERNRADRATALLALVREEARRETENEIDEDGDPLLPYDYVEGLHDARAGIEQIFKKFDSTT